MQRETKAISESKNRATRIIAAIIGAAGIIIASVIGLNLWKDEKAADPNDVVEGGMIGSDRATRLTGRVVNARSQKPLQGVKVTLEAGNIPPIVRATDEEGVFDFGLPKDIETVRVRVDAPGYRVYTRLIHATSSSGIEEIRLEPGASSPSPQPVVYDGTGGRKFEPPAPVRTSIVDETLPRIAGGSGPWAVVIYGPQQDRRGDVQSWVRSTLAGAGHDSISLFRRVSDEQRVAPELYRGSNELFESMQAQRFCSRILVGRFAVTTIGTYEGLTTAEAKLAVHVMSPLGEMLKSFELSEKGGGLDEESAKRRAVDELRTVIEADLPASI